MARKLVQYGAGNIGRSLAGQLFSAAGWEVVFIDVVPEVIQALNRENRYRVVVKEEVPSELWVEGVRGVDGREVDQVAEEIAGCDLLSTAVGSKVLPHIALPIARGLELRTAPLNMILCENLRGAPDLVRSYLEEHLPEGFSTRERVGLIATSIGKMVPIMPPEVRDSDPLEVWAEAYNQIIADRDGFLGAIPDVEGLVVRGCFEAYVDQKLFVHNMGHAVCAYLGDQFGAVTIAEAMHHERISQITQRAMEESGKALVSLYSDELEVTHMRDYIEDLIRRFKNVALGDTVYRVGRDRMRKFAPDDRLIGSLFAQRKSGVGSESTLKGIAAGFRFSATDPTDERLASDIEFDEILKVEGVPGILTKICGLDPNRDSDWFEKLSVGGET